MECTVERAPEGATGSKSEDMLKHVTEHAAENEDVDFGILRGCSVTAVARAML